MNPAEIVELALDIGNRVDVQWGLFVTVHMALLGAIVYLDEPLHRIEKVVAFAVYLGFVLINFSQMHSQLALLNAAYADLHLMANSGSESQLISRMASDHLAGRHRYATHIVNMSHGAMVVLVSLSIVFDQALTKKVK